MLVIKKVQLQQVDLKVIGDKSDCDGSKSNDSSSSVVNIVVGVNSSSRKNFFVEI